MTDTQQSSRRGGREARRALRAAPLATDVRPVNPGMESGRYKVLSDADVQRVHLAALDVLEKPGDGVIAQHEVVDLARFPALRGLRFTATAVRVLRGTGVSQTLLRAAEGCFPSRFHALFAAGRPKQ